MRTQWRSAGMAGAFIGLDYAALANVEQRIGLPASEQRQAFAGLQVFEAAQLAQWREDEKAQVAKGKHG
jgi:phage terminase Nu1 subunit (DNA packaging protein)